MKNGDFFNKIKRLRLNVTKFHRHVFENLGYMLQIPLLSHSRILLVGFMLREEEN